MSTSYKTLFPSSAPAPVESFRYPEAQGGDATGASETEVAGIGDEIPHLLLRAHAGGVREGEEREKARGQQQLEEQRAKIAEAILHFHTSVAEYFSRTESEAVQLALAIAAKILHREAQADPALVSKLAKTVLNNLHQQTKVKVRIPPQQVEMWTKELSAYDQGKIALEIVADESVQVENCVLETDLGTTDVGLAAQLREIENGLLDLLAQSTDQQ
jgi:flagellar assembly protein FliH